MNCKYNPISLSNEEMAEGFGVEVDRLKSPANFKRTGRFFRSQVLMSATFCLHE